MVSPMDFDLLRRVTRCTMRLPFRMWGFGEAIALDGLLSASPLINDREPSGFVTALVRATLTRGIGAHPEDHVAPGRSLLSLYRQTDDDGFLEGARKLAALYASLPENHFGAKLHRFQQPGWRNQIWVDHMDVDAPFLAALAAITGEECHLQLAVHQLLAYARALQDETNGLMWHGYESSCGRNGELWARGNGWALMGITETLREIPGNDHSRAEILERLRSLLRGLARLQDASGLWHTVLDDPSTYLETTLATIVVRALSVLRGYSCDSTSEMNEFESMALAARAAVLQHIDDEGALQLVSDATPIGTRRMYATRPFGVFPWGQGPLLLMLSVEAKSQNENRKG
jgi:unsaturated rhamnogalacturonyl hydrolase